MLDSGIWVFESQHDQTFLMEPTSHAFPKLLLIREGRGDVIADWPHRTADSLHCVSGDCVLLPADLQHRIIDDPAHPISLYGLGLDPKRISSLREIEGLIHPGRIPRQRVQRLAIERRIRRLLFQVAQRDPAFRLSAVAGAIEIFAQLAMPTPAEHQRGTRIDQAIPADDALDEYLQWLASNFFESLSVDDAAKACHMSRRKFTAEFRKRTGTTWLAYINDKRVSHAVTLLQTTNSKVTSIAFQSGFEDLSTFYRSIKRVTGKRPLDFRPAAD
ncbi:HTH-type transcriptional activator RhaR [Rubripirellula lacrimiformis]|uniref:HTH-type transcriptional activator RhaR n=2 Tax=Rubripirellula lacrimiformis TaxID=1930273 RepID=A0A517NKE4_9BACT|nr:HTH-type transcriptional activator RhaR [Rubripirellula lacrimiformis]